MSLFMEFSFILLVSFSNVAQHKEQEAIIVNNFIIYVVSKKFSNYYQQLSIKFSHGSVKVIV